MPLITPQETERFITTLTQEQQREVGRIIEATWRAENTHKTARYNKKPLLEFAKLWRKIAKGIADGKYGYRNIRKVLPSESHIQ